MCLFVRLGGDDEIRAHAELRMGAGMGGMGCRRVGEQRVLPLCHQNCLWDNVSFGEQQMRGASFWFYIFCFGAFETEV
jgi:hypothetical protein